MTGIQVQKRERLSETFRIVGNDNALKKKKCLGQTCTFISGCRMQNGVGVKYEVCAQL